MSACNDISSEQSMLDTAESLLDTHADSARSLLDSIRPQVEQKNVRRLTMRYRLLMASALNKTYGQLPSDTAFSEVVRYYDHHGNSNERMRVHYLLGCIYRDMGEAPQAIQCYQDATEYADTLRANCDYNTLFRIYAQMADVYAKQFLTEEALIAQQKTMHYAKKAHDIYHYIHAYELTLNSYNIMDDTAMIVHVTNESHRLFMANGMPQHAANVYPSLIRLYLDHSEYEKAKPLMDVFEKESGLFDEDGNIINPRRTNYYNSKGLYYMGIHRVDSAEYFFRKLLSCSVNDYASYKGLLAVYQAKHNQDSIVKYANLCERGLENMLENIQMEATKQVTAMYNYNRVQNQVNKKEQEVRRIKIIIGVSLLLTCLIAVYVYVHIRKNRKRSLAQINQLNTNYLEAMNEVDRAKADMAAIQADYTLFVCNKEKDIAELEQKVAQYQSQIDSLNSSEREEALLSSNPVETFRKFTYPLQPLPHKSDWLQLTRIVRQSLPTFYAKVAQENLLSPLQLRTCLLTRLKFTNSEISILLNITPQQVTNTKTAINEKLFGQKTATTLMANLKSL
jgi:tetratricopeptide (TPR) repeat protein